METKTKIGVIERAIEKGDGNKKRHVYLVDDDWYTDWDAKRSFKEGDKVSIEYSEKGAFKNINEIALAETTQEELPKAEAKTSDIYSNIEKDLDFARNYALKYAIEDAGADEETRLMNTIFIEIQKRRRDER